MNNMYESFLGLYPLSKTLRFELKPIGKTLENMNKKEILSNDENKAVDYKKVKKIIDEYHKYFMEKILKNFEFNNNELEEYYQLLMNKEKDKEKLDKTRKKLRKDIINFFTKKEEFKKIFGKEMITELLPEFLENDDKKGVVKNFENFTTYFKGFNENRKNMYSEDEKSTSIAYRLINENFPVFVNNMISYSYFCQVIPKEIKDKIFLELTELIQVEELDDMFKLEYFNDVLTQKGIDVYNQIIGGVSLENNKKIKGINEYINEYKQKNPQDKKIMTLKMLYKQILSDSQTASFVLENFENDNQIFQSLRQFSLQINLEIIEKENNLEKLLNSIEKYDLSKIYVKNDLIITEISNELYGEWSIINNAISNWYDEHIVKNKKSSNYEENKKKYLKAKAYFSIEFLNSITKYNENYVPIEKYFLNIQKNNVNILKNILDKYEILKNLIFNEYPKNKKLKQDEKSILIIKEYLDSVKEVELFIKPLLRCINDVGLEKDNNFYDKLNEFWKSLELVTPIYNKIRNYLTGKVYSVDKIKLNFNNQSLLKGWDVNKEKENKSIILLKDNKYYLGIFDKACKVNIIQEDVTENYYKKMNYKLLPGPNKMLPKVFFADSNVELYNPPINLLQKYQQGLHKKGNQFDLKFCHELIDFFKESIDKNCDWKKFNFKFTETEKYNDISEFYKEVEAQGYKIEYSKISEKSINELINEGDLYLFQIHNKDFSEYSHGTQNLHTLYWKMLFDERNLSNVVYKLNGEAEMFYRKASIERKITHPQNINIKNKNELNPKKESKFEYDLIKNKRFTEDKFFLHVPITLNFKNKGISNINEEINKKIKNEDDNYIIGIDRGERNLLYLVLINSKGEIIKQFSLNEIINENRNVEYRTDYHTLLDNKEKEREKQRESWKSIENIKELKEGYLSQVINKITNLMIEYNAIVVLEDLNFGFMRGRQKFEKQVYQKFEKMLIDKLNYLVKKDLLVTENGGLLKAYQLTNKFESFKQLKKQSGVLFYIPAWNTSKMDPATGFVNLFYIKYENKEKAKEFFDKFENIRFNKNKDYFEFEFDYNKFTEKANGTRTKWVVCTNGERIINFRNKEKNSEWDCKEVVLTSEFKKLFEDYSINYNNGNFKNEILQQDSKEFFESLINLFKLVVQMRNSSNKLKEDYIISPVANEKGEFFDSRRANTKFPIDADANGAYNIARKGLWVINQIKSTPDDKLKNVKLAVTNKEWLKFVQEKKWE